MARSALFGKKSSRSNASRQVDQIASDDMALFQLGAQNVNYLTDHYVRTPSSGTYWRRNSEPPDPERSAAWVMMHHAWTLAGKPDKEFVYPLNDIAYVVQRDSAGDPVFWHRHGWLWQNWQRIAYHASQSNKILIGGYGSGKTAYIGMTLAILAMTIPNFRGFAVAPQMLQANEVFVWLNKTLQGTIYWDRFVWSVRQKPYPQIIIRNSYVGESSIEILSVEKDPAKILTLEGDIAFLDQAEKIDGVEDKSLKTMLRNLGTRLRGQTHGRTHLGVLNIIANSAENPDLWDLYDRAEDDPENWFAYSPTSYENQYLSKKDIKNFEDRVGGDEDSIRMYMKGGRPLGNGTEFPRQMVEGCIDKSMNSVMDAMIEAKTPGFYKEEKKGVGLYRWEMPPDHKGKRDYIVIGDPGSFNPPDRNSPPIMVWDVTNFPKEPARMRAFNWVFGNGYYTPFLSAYQSYVEDYRAWARNGFDNTGSQKGFDELSFVDMGLAAEGMNMAGGGKMMAINSLKYFLGKRMMLFPAIPHLGSQLTGYRLPDHNVRQDLVMCMAMSASYIRRYFYSGIIHDEEDEFDELDEDGYHYNSRDDRYSRKGGGDRYSRSRDARR